MGIGHRSFKTANKKPYWFIFLVLKRDDECAEVQTCEWCQNKITVKQYEDGEYVHTQAIVYGEVDDDFYVHPWCEQERIDELRKEWARQEGLLRERLRPVIQMADPEVEALIQEEEAIHNANQLRGLGW